MSSPLRPGASHDEELDYYKRQYEQLETDLADFQASSKELEEQLERDIEAAEKNERKLKEQVESLRFEVEEWKTKHGKAKTEANGAQNALQKEITSMRETNRSLQLQLRDTEVMNDDYERQARNTESSLEDLESKYNVAIERGVLLEEEVKHGEQERESLRIEAQRLRDELGDLKVENEITLEKLRLADDTIERLRSRKPSPMAVESLRPRSPASEASGLTPSSPTASTPPPKSDSASDAPTPPSPPLSDAPAQVKAEAKTPSLTKRRSLIPDASATPRPGGFASSRPPPLKHTRGLSVNSSSSTATSEARTARTSTARSRPSIGPPPTQQGLPRSESLYQIRNLRGRMQKIEERVHSARSKLPAPQNRTPRGSPRTASTSVTAATDGIPSSVTMRRSIKRPSISTTSHHSEAAGSDNAAGSDATSTGNKRRESAVKRLSYGIPRPTSSLSERPTSALDRPPSAAATGRPGSRTSFASGNNHNNPGRPSSRTSGAFSNGAHPPPARPPSGLAGTFSTMNLNAAANSQPGTAAAPRRTHRPSASISELRQHASASASASADASSDFDSDAPPLLRPSTARPRSRGNEDPFSASRHQQNQYRSGGNGNVYSSSPSSSPNAAGNTANRLRRRQSATNTGASAGFSPSKTLRGRDSMGVLGSGSGSRPGSGNGAAGTGTGKMLPPPSRIGAAVRRKTGDVGSISSANGNGNAGGDEAGDVGETY